MSTVAESLTMALYRHRAGDLRGAEAIYRQILEVDPTNADAMRLLGLAAHQQGNFAEAIARFCAVAQLQPLDATSFGSLANALADQGMVDEAIANYQQALTLDPNLAELHYNLANNLRQMRRLDEAVASYQRALALRPNYEQAHNNLGNVLHEQNNFDQAIVHYREAIRLNPGLVQPHNNMGTALRKLGRLKEAAASYQEALRLLPSSAEIHNNLGGVFADQQDLQNAASCFQQAVSLDPTLVETRAALGIALYDLGRHDEGLAHLKQAVNMQPTNRLRIALATRLPAIYQSMDDMQSARQRLIHEVRQLRQQQVVLDVTNDMAANVFYLAYHGLNDRDVLRDIAGLFRAPQEVVAKPLTAAKTRVGMLSSFFRNHTIGHLMRGTVAQLARDDFEVTVLSAGTQGDDVTEAFMRDADHFLQIPRHLPSARRLIAQQQLDILLYSDIGMDPFSGTLAYSRLAPVQCVTWGHPVTTGIDTIDYFISSEDLETATSDQHYTEKLVRLKTLPIYYDKPTLPDPLHDREHFGLTKDDHVYACPQSVFKFHPEFDDLLGAILRGDPRGILVLIKSKLTHFQQQLQQRLAATLPDVAGRIRFLPALARPDYLNLLAVCDVLLDPLHFGGGNTSYEGLAVGTPIVTLPSQFLCGRITFALYRQMSMLDCVVETRDDYVKLALRLGTDAGFRSSMRSKILAHAHVLFENAAGIRELERFFQMAVR